MFTEKPADEEFTDRNTVVFNLNILCELNNNAPKDSTEPSEIYKNHELLSSHLQWVPAGEQSDVFADHPPAPTNPNIVLAKLRPGQAVEMELHAVKGIGKDHAKFSPVGLSFSLPISCGLHASFTCSATASFRLLPHIRIKQPIPPHLAEKFQQCFAPGVVNIHPHTKEVSIDEYNVRKDTVSREVLRHPEFLDSVELSRVRDHFLCALILLCNNKSCLTMKQLLSVNIESEGPYAPERLLLEAIKIMREKISVLRKAADSLLVGDSPDDIDVQMSEV